MQKITDISKVLMIFILLIIISGCSSLSEMISTAEIENLQVVKREKPNLSSEASKIDIDPDSDELMEEKFNSDSIQDNSKTAPKIENEPEENFDAKKETSDSTVVATHNSFGKVKIGMTILQASEALGLELVAPDGDGECYYVKPKQGFDGVEFMVINEVIARIDFTSNKYSTDKGAKIGDTEEKIKSLYRGIEVHPQKYDEKLHDMEIYSDDKKYLIIFETNGKVVTGFRIGRAEEVSWVERCG